MKIALIHDWLIRERANVGAGLVPAQRKTIRLKGYDYSQDGSYFVTICVQNKECLFGEIVHGEMNQNKIGQMIKEQWLQIPTRFKSIQLGQFVVMPNHFHGIISMVSAPLVDTLPRAGTRPAPTLSQIIGAFKSITTTEYITGTKQDGWKPFKGKLWQRNFYEHVIRDEKSFTRIHEYILTNPSRWNLDKENPEHVEIDNFDRWLDSFSGRPQGAPLQHPFQKGICSS